MHYYCYTRMYKVTAIKTPPPLNQTAVTESKYFCIRFCVEYLINCTLLFETIFFFIFIIFSFNCFIFNRMTRQLAVLVIIIICKSLSRAPQTILLNLTNLSSL